MTQPLQGRMDKQPTTGLTAVEALRLAKEKPGTFARPANNRLFNFMLDRRDGLWYEKVYGQVSKKHLFEEALPQIPIGWLLEPWEHHPTSDTL
jgi:hypothetical protein